MKYILKEKVLYRRFSDNPFEFTYEKIGSIESDGIVRTPGSRWFMPEVSQNEKLEIQKLFTIGAL